MNHDDSSPHRAHNLVALMMAAMWLLSVTSSPSSSSSSSSLVFLLCQAESTASNPDPTQLRPRRPLNGMQLAVGEWDVELRPVGPPLASALDLKSRIFPATKSSNKKAKQQRRKSSLACSLSMAEDGTFVMQPKEQHDSDFGKRQRQRQSFLPLRGQWKLLPNPYCVTDRFYDLVALTSYPRQEVNQNDGSVIQTVELTLHCRLWGRHGMGKGLSQPPPSPTTTTTVSNAAKTTRSSTTTFVQQQTEIQQPHGKMTHGTLVWIERQSTAPRNNSNSSVLPWWRRRRPILASISGRRVSTEPSHEGWIDEKEFEY